MTPYFDPPDKTQSVTLPRSAVLYVGERGAEEIGTCKVWKLVKGRKKKLLDPARSQRVYNHSPDGFEWGYGGSGPAQLALALCLDVLGQKQRALAIYQDFKFRIIGGLDRDRWELSQDFILATIEELERERPK
jgi:hypothetical protein